MKSGDFIWSDDNIAAAAKLWEQGLSASAIGRQFHVSRSSVLGVAHRNRDLFKKRVPTRSKTMSREDRFAVAAKRQSIRAKPAREARPKSDMVGRIKSAPPVFPRWAREPDTLPRYDLSRFQVDGANPVAFVDLHQNQCRFPLERMDVKSGPATPCCGIKTNDLRGYCDVHRQVMTRSLD